MYKTKKKEGGEGGGEIQESSEAVQIGWLHL